MFDPARVMGGFHCNLQYCEAQARVSARIGKGWSLILEIQFPFAYIYLPKSYKKCLRVSIYLNLFIEKYLCNTQIHVFYIQQKYEVEACWESACLGLVSVYGVPCAVSAGRVSRSPSGHLMAATLVGGAEPVYSRAPDQHYHLPVHIILWLYTYIMVCQI